MDGPPLAFRPGRLPFLLLAAAPLSAGIWGGLRRIGWDLPGAFADWVSWHGPLMVTGFLGTLISLERAAGFESQPAEGGRIRMGAVRVRRTEGQDVPRARRPVPRRSEAGCRASAWAGRAAAYAIPLLSGLAAALAMAGSPAGADLACFAAAGLVLLFAFLLLRHPDLPTLAMGLGAACWLGGNLAWRAGTHLSLAVPAWEGFLLLTIAGERLELSRFLAPPRWAIAAFAGTCLLFLGGAAGAAADPDAAVRTTGAAMLLLSAWLGRFDMARRTVRQPGLPRFIAANLLAGYAWLAVGGAWRLLAGHSEYGYAYDAALHAFFAGFVLSMVFAHAPVIFPAVLGTAVPFRRLFYAHAALLHASLALRVAGDALESGDLRSWGAMGNAAAVALFLIATAASAILARRKRG